jgi:hypothetical protein
MYGFNIKIVGEMQADAEQAAANLERIKRVVAHAIGAIVASVPARVDCAMINGQEIKVEEPAPEPEPAPAPEPEPE